MNEEQQYFLDRIVVDPGTGCWLWQLRKDRHGYGRVTLKTKLYKKYRSDLVSRLAYLVFKGEVPNGYVVRHKCRSRHCCNPDHLEPGTPYENNQDKKRDGTNVGSRGNNKGCNAGTKHGQSKLLDEQVVSMRALFATGQYTQRKLADMFSISAPVVSDIVNNKTWLHLLQG